MPEWLRHSASLSCCVNNPEFNSHFLIFINLDNLVTKFHTDELQKSHPTVGDISNIDTAKGKIIEEGVGRNLTLKPLMICWPRCIRRIH